jgi:predicted nucleotidyltransferase
MDARNRTTTTANELYELLRSLSPYLEHSVPFYALGGTALTILGIKASTLDVDIAISTKKDYEAIHSLFEKIGFKKLGVLRYQTQEGLFFDLFQAPDILGTVLLPDFTEKATFIRTIGSIELYTLGLEDIIITKLARGDSRDFDDIKSILDTQSVALPALVFCYKETMETSIVAHYQQKLLDLIEIKCKEWKFSIDKNLIKEVKAWE